MHGYQHLIVAVTGCTPAETVAVEGLMRLRHPTLDHLRPDEFAFAAEVGFGAMQQLQADEQIDLPTLIARFRLA